MRKYYDFLWFNKNCVASNCIEGIPARVRSSVETNPCMSCIIFIVAVGLPSVEIKVTKKRDCLTFTAIDKYGPG